MTKTKATAQKSILRLCLPLIISTLLLVPAVASAQDNDPKQYQELVERYAPVLYFHPFELFRPQTVNVLVDTSRLRLIRSGWFDHNILLKVSLPDLGKYNEPDYILDSWFGDAGTSDYKNYTAHRAFYQAVLSPDVGGYPIVTYAHIVDDEVPGQITIQYWLFYYYNDSFNKHEGDWEFVQVILSELDGPEWVVLSQHHGGSRRAWKSVQVEDETHPAVHVALGSHANYFWGDESYPNGVTIGNTRVEIYDHTGTYDRTIPQTILIPDREAILQDQAAWQGFEWLLFRGRWGEVGAQADFSGPFGPADKGLQWSQPYTWGIAQPEDTRIWYKNRFRVEITSPQNQEIRIELKDASGDPIPEADLSASIAILHDDTILKPGMSAEFDAPVGQPFDLRVVWPNPDQSIVNSYNFAGLTVQEPGLTRVDFLADLTPILTLPGAIQAVPFTIHETQKISTRPDTVWMIGYLQANEVAVGLVLSLVAGILPTIVLVTALYRSDSYEKEPRHLLAAAFFWGAIPSLMIALVVRVFFKVPLDLLGPEALEAVRAGFVSPLVEETLKGAAVLAIAWRYRLEFDDVLDGIIYGAMTGFGFAMSANIISYMGAFVLHGFLGLGSTIFIEGIIFGVNQAMYTAIFGAGLGYARMAYKKWQRILVPAAAFILAVVTNGFHRLAMQNVVGLDLRSVVVTWVGLGVLVTIMGLSLQRQKRIMILELAGEIPASLFSELSKPGGLNRIALNALWKKGEPGYRAARKLSQDCAELAFKKNQLRAFPEDQSTSDVIEQLRTEIGLLLESIES